MIAARNKFERIEVGMGWVGWVVVANIIPVVLGKYFAKYYNRYLSNSFRLKGQNILDVPLEYCDKALLKNHAHVSKIAKEIGLSNKKRLPQLLHNVLRGKLFIISSSLFFMALQGQGVPWGQNWIVEKLSGKKGYSGEFNYTSEAYRQFKTKTHEKTKWNKLKLSLALGISRMISFPIFIFLALSHPKLAQTMPLKFVKKYVPYVNYVNIGQYL